MKDLIVLLARICVSTIFLLSAFGKITDFSGTLTYMESAGMPSTTFFLVGAIFLLLSGGFSVLLGYQAKTGALLLLAFLIPATLIFHSDLGDKMEQISFLKNMSIAGGLLMIFAFGAGKYRLGK